MDNEQGENDKQRKSSPTYNHKWITFRHIPLNNFISSAFFDDRWQHLSDPIVNILGVLETVTAKTSQLYCLLQCSFDHQEVYPIDTELLITVNLPEIESRGMMAGHQYGRYNVPCLNINMSTHTPGVDICSQTLIS